MATAAAVLAASSCTAQGSGERGARDASADADAVSTFAIVTPEKADDYGYNQQGVDAARQVADDLGIDVEVADGSGYEDVGPVLRELSTGGAQLVIAQASGYNTTAAEVADETGVPALVWGDPRATKPGICADVATQSQEGAYLAGVLAATSSSSGVLGVVLSADDVNWNRMAGGFVAGARATDPSVTIRLAQIGQAAYADAAGGRRVTQAVIAGGADVVFGMGDGAAFGMIKAVEEADGVRFIDVIGDKRPVDREGVLLSSVYWDLSGIYRDAVEDVGSGDFGRQGYTIDLANEGVSLLRTDLVDARAWDRVQEARRRIVDGTTDVPVTDTKAAVESMIRG